MTRPHTLPLLALLALLALGCGADLAVPRDARVTCTPAAACPGGFVCNETVGRCVPERGGDTQPPALDREGVVVAPEVVSATAVLTVTLEVTEALDRPPVVRLGTPERPALTLSATDGLTYSYHYAPSGTEPEGAVPITASLIDISGNAAADVGVGQVRFDFGTPSVEIAGVTPPWVRRDREVTLTLRIDEPLPTAPAAVLEGTDVAFVCPAPAEPPQVPCSLLAGDAVEEGAYDLAVEVRDRAGNVGRTRAAAVVTFDDTAPVLARDPAVAPRWARPGTTVSIEVEAEEAGVPSVRLVREGDDAALEPVLADSLGGVSIFEHVTTPEDAGWWTLVVDCYADLAGNEGGEHRTPQALLVDAAAPELDEPASFDREPPAYRAGDRIELGFSTSEDLSATPPTAVLALEPERPMPCRSEALGRTWRCATESPLDGSEEPEGVVDVGLRLADLAGWVSEDRLPLRLDFTPPEIVAARPGSAAYGIGATISYTVMTSEPLAGSGLPELRFVRDGEEVVGGLGPVQRVDETTFVCSAAVDAAMEGTWEVEVRLEDPAGNDSGWTRGGGFTADGTPPTVTFGPQLDREPARYGPGDELVLRVGFDEPLVGGGPVATLHVGSPRALECAPEADAGAWACSLPGGLSGEERPQGSRSVTIEARDAAGNLALLGIGLTLDFDAPRLVAGGTSFSRCDGFAPAVAGPADLWLRPDLDCGDGVHPLTIRFRVDEPTDLATAPTLLAAGLAMDCERLGGEPGGTSFAFGCRPTGRERETDSRHPDDAGLEVTADVADRVGNAARVVLGTLRFDSVPPRPGAYGRGLAGVTLVRDPWGSEASGYRPRAVLRLAPDAALEPGVVRVFRVVDGAAPGEDAEGIRYRRLELGSTVFAPGEAAEVALREDDVSVVHVTSTDRAGNESDADRARQGKQAVGVSAIELVSTLNGWRDDGGAANPHALQVAMPQAGETMALDLHAALVDEPDVFAGVARLGDGLVGRASAAHTPWLPAADGMVPPGRREHTPVYDSARDRVVVFGGQSNGCGEVAQGPCGDTWEWDGVRWVERHPRRSPPPRWDHAMVYDPTRGRTVLFGGRSQEAPLGDTWTWDGVDWRLHDLAPSPGPRPDAAMAWDPETERILLFGGGALAFERCGDEPHYCGDTWAWDGAAWEQLHPQASPPARGGAAMGWDPAEGRLLLVAGLGYCWSGGRDVGSCYDTWAWGGGTWTRVGPESGPDSGLWSARAVVDPVGERLLVFVAGPAMWIREGDDWVRGPAPPRLGDGGLGRCSCEDPGAGAEPACRPECPGRRRVGDAAARRPAAATGEPDPHRRPRPSVPGAGGWRDAHVRLGAELGLGAGASRLAGPAQRLVLVPHFSGGRLVGAAGGTGPLRGL